eukprot:5501228-Prymnesium_polylepis.1
MVRFDDRDRRARVLLRALLRALPGWKRARLSTALPLAQVKFAGNRAARLAYARFDLQARVRHRITMRARHTCRFSECTPLRLHRSARGLAAWVRWGWAAGFAAPQLGQRGQFCGQIVLLCA